MAELFGDNAFNEFAECVFQCDGVICVGFNAIRFYWFAKYDHGGSIEGCGEISNVDRCLD